LCRVARLVRIVLKLAQQEAAMYTHHQRTITRLVQRFQADPQALALIIIGSVARGDARAESDVDSCLVVTDAAYRERSATGALSFDATDLAQAEYVGGQAGGGIVDVAFLHELAARGPEPARFAFSDALIAFSRVPDLAALIRRIPVYPEGERMEKIISFASQLPVHLAYLRLGEYSGNPYLLAQTTVELVLFGGRLILAHNRLLYPGRKWFMRQLELAAEKPAGLLDLATHLLRQPRIAAAEAFCQAITRFRAWPQAPEGAMARFQRDRELVWRNGITPLADR
jgi:predicted nucleotidyltransferase